MNKLLIALAAAVVILPSGAVLAQRDYNRGGNPLDDFLNRMANPHVSTPMGCDVRNALDRNGNIIWMQMTCRAQDYRR
jgi:hypothetical protein